MGGAYSAVWYLVTCLKQGVSSRPTRPSIPGAAGAGPRRHWNRRVMIRVYPEYRLEDERGRCPVITLLGEGYARSCCVGVPPRRAKYLGCGSAGIVGRTAVQGSICPTYVDEPASWMPSPHSCPDITLTFPSLRSPITWPCARLYDSSRKRPHDRGPGNCARRAWV